MSEAGLSPMPDSSRSRDPTMTPTHQPLFPDAFLAARWGGEYARFRGSATEGQRPNQDRHC